MSSLRWLNPFRLSAKAKASRAARKARAKARISFEPLETRCLLAATLTWLGTNSTLWNDPGNWNTGTIPGQDGPGDTLVFNGGANDNFTNVDNIGPLNLASIQITGSSGLDYTINKNDATDTVVLTGPNGIVNNTTGTGTTVSLAGITVAPDQATPAASADIWQNQQGTLNVTSPITFDADTTLVVQGAIGANVNTILAGGFTNLKDAATAIAPATTDALSAVGGGTLTLSGNLSLAGNTTLYADASSLMAVGVTPGANTLALNGNTLTADAVGPTTATGGLVEVADNITGAGSLSKIDTGTLGLGGDDSGSSATVGVSGGILALASQNALPTGNVTVNGGSLGLYSTSVALGGGQSLTINGAGENNNGAIENLLGNNSLSGTITLGSAASIGADSGTTLSLTSSIDNSAHDLTLVGAGNLDLTSVSTLNNLVGDMASPGVAKLTARSRSAAPPPWSTTAPARCPSPVPPRLISTCTATFSPSTPPARSPSATTSSTASARPATAWTFTAT